MKKRIMRGIAIILSCFLFPLTNLLAEDISGTTISGNAAEPNGFYERSVRLNNNDLLMTWCREFPINSNWQGMKSYLFFKSSDNGKTWIQVSELDPSNWEGLSSDKMGMCGMYVLPQSVGNYSAGTVLFATSDWSSNEYCIHIWRSEDNGITWQKHSDLAARGTDNQTVWEPEFQMLSDGSLVCYYSDERQEGYDQCIAEEISTDGGITWGSYSIIAGKYIEGWVRGVSPTQWRPGMPRVEKLSNGSYFMVYENIGDGNNGKVSYRISSDGINWGEQSDIGTLILSGSYECHQCPELAVLNNGTGADTIFVRGMNDTCSPSELFMSTDHGQSWQLAEAPLTLVRNENKGSSWSGTLLGFDNHLVEINNYYNGSWNEIRSNSAYLSNGQIFVNGAEYKISNSANNFCLDDAGGSTSWGTTMILWTDNNEKTQSWMTHDNGDGSFTLINQFSNLALDNPNGSNADGTLIQQWDVNYSPAESWRFLAAGNGYFRIQNVCSGLYLDTENNSTSLHANIAQNSLSDSATQLWKIERIYSIARFRSFNISDCHVYHDTSGALLIANQSTSLALKSSQWKLVNGLADSNAVSFESVDQPGYYLRHKDGKVIISQNDGTDLFKNDATWIMHEGLSDTSGNSFETYNYSGQYIRHYNSYLIISSITTDLDKLDATFILEKQ